ncbi:MAG: hypothetical protein DRI65_16310 [Chloroflexota bacterium]|nr:MAG: hypothetical protein DRI65_16310 [Chloroflexota bacterium]
MNYYYSLIDSRIIAELSDISHDRLFCDIANALPVLISMGEADPKTCELIDEGEAVFYSLDLMTSLIILSGYSTRKALEFSRDWSGTIEIYNDSIYRPSSESDSGTDKDSEISSLRLSAIMDVDHEALIINLVRMKTDCLISEHEGQTYYVLPHAIAIAVAEDSYGDKVSELITTLSALRELAAESRSVEQIKDRDMLLRIILGFTEEDCRSRLGTQPFDLFNPFQSECYKIMSELVGYHYSEGATRGEVRTILTAWHDDIQASAVASLSVGDSSTVKAILH